MLKRTTIIICSSLIFILLVTGFIYTYYLKISALPEWYTTDAKNIAADSVSDTVIVRTKSIMEPPIYVDQPDQKPSKPISAVTNIVELKPKKNRKNNQAIIKPPEKKKSRIPRPRKAPSKSERSPRKSVAKQVEPIEIITSDIPDLIYDQIDLISSGQARQLLKAVRSNISPRAIDIEMIVDINQLQALSSVSGPEFQTLIQLMNTSNLKELYLQFKLIPVYQNDVVTIKPESTIKIGDILFDLRELESQFGVKLDQFQLPAPGYNKLKLRRGKIILN